MAEQTDELLKLYHQAWKTPSDIDEHQPLHFALASECSSVVEIGVRSMTSTWAFLAGLPAGGSYIGIDIVLPSAELIEKAGRLASAKNVAFSLIQQDSVKVEMTKEVDMIFIDSLHTYAHLTTELHKYAPLARKYITLHDSSEPWGFQNETTRSNSVYPTWVDMKKNGLWQAVVDFLAANPDWKLEKRYFNRHGFTILGREKSLW